jgi:hypothetical protein
MTHHESGAAAESVIGQATQSVFADLIARLEKATGPSFELDEAIWCALNPDHDSTTYNGDPYTQSLDAALTLVPEGWSGTITIRPTKFYAYLCSDFNDDYAKVFWSHQPSKREPGTRKYPHPTSGSPTPAIALCIAALKARVA